MTEVGCWRDQAACRDVVTAEYDPFFAAWQSSTHGDEDGLRTVINEAIVRTPNLPLTVGSDLQKRRSAQR